MKKIISNLRWAGLGLVLFILSCASINVARDTVKTHGKLTKPSIIYVRGFNIATGKWTAPEGQSLDLFKKVQQDTLKNKLLQFLAEVAPTKSAPSDLPNKGLLVTGDFVEVDEGSSFDRAMWGFTAGERIAVTNVKIYDLAQSKTEPAVSFRAEGGSRAQAGIYGASEHLDEDWDRTAREVRDFLKAQFKMK